MNEQKAEKNPILEQAWQKFADYDDNAKKLKKSFSRFQKCILWLGGLATLLVLVQTQFVKNSQTGIPYPLGEVLRVFIILIPITITILTVASKRFISGNIWIYLRVAAEKIKSEIYRFRLLATLNITPPDQGESWDKNLWKKLTEIDDQLTKEKVFQTPIKEYKGPIPPDMGGEPDNDDGFNALTAGQYIKIRIDDQLNYYKKNTIKMERQLKWCLWLIYILGGLGTFLAAIKLELWVALTTSIAGIFTTYLRYMQVENNLMVYNQTIRALTDVKIWWNILTGDQKQKVENIKNLLDSTENIFQAKQNRWMQNMKTALETLQENKTSADQK